MKIRLFLAPIFFCYFTSNAQMVEDTSYKEAFSFINSSHSIKHKLKDLIGQEKIDGRKDWFFVCPTLQFINLATFWEQLSPHQKLIAIREEILSDRLSYRKQYFFEPIEMPGLTRINGKSKKSNFLVSFSRQVENVVPMVIFFNDFDEVYDPCEDLSNPKFGKALVVIVILNRSTMNIEKVICNEIVLN